MCLSGQVQSSKLYSDIGVVGTQDTQQREPETRKAEPVNQDSQTEVWAFSASTQQETGRRGFGGGTSEAGLRRRGFRGGASVSGKGWGKSR